MKAAVLLAAGAVGAVSLLGITSCSDNKLDLSSAQTAPDISIPDISIPDISLPANIPGLEGDCAAFYAAFAAAFAGGSQSVNDALPQAIDDLQASLPEDLHDDLETVGQAFAKLEALYKKYGNDPAKAAGDPAFAELFSDPDFTEASANIQSWLDENCDQG